MFQFLRNFFVHRPTLTLVYEEDKVCGGYFVYAREFPEVGGSGRTKTEALKNLLDDLKAVGKLKPADSRKLSFKGQVANV